MNPDLSNALAAMPDGPFMRDLAQAVTNSGDVDSGAAWLLELTARYLEGEGLAHSLLAFDHCVWDAEALDRIWPAVQASEAEQGLSCGPQLARYLAERLPAIWDKQSWTPFSPVTRAVRMGRVLPFKDSRQEDDEKHVHPLQLDVIDRCVELFSNKGETVFSPFMGVGSEVYSPIVLGRRGMGAELKESYFRQAVQNVEAAAQGYRFDKTNEEFAFAEGEAL